jgi:hypothetical protein
METLREELIRKKIILTWEEWWEQVKDAFTLVHNSLNPNEVYEEYVNDIVKSYEEIEKNKKKN